MSPIVVRLMIRVTKENLRLIDDNKTGKNVSKGRSNVPETKLLVEKIQPCCKSIFNQTGNTGWPKSHDTGEKIEYLHYGSIKRAHFFTKNRGKFILQIHTNKVSANPC